MDADQWTWLISAAHARFPLAADLRLPWQRPAAERPIGTRRSPEMLYP